MAKKRKWILDSNKKVLSCDLGKFNLDKLAEPGTDFSKFYGVKQILADSIAGKDKEDWNDAVTAAWEKLCNPKCFIEIKDSGTFTLTDPDATRANASLARLENSLKAEETRYNEAVEQLKAGGQTAKQAKELADKLFGSVIKELKVKVKKIKEAESK
jgi:hypothetical protein